jgi:hypothetical protein
MGLPLADCKARKERPEDQTRHSWSTTKWNIQPFTPSPRPAWPIALDESGCFAIFSDAFASLIAAT